MEVNKISQLNTSPSAGKKNVSFKANAAGLTESLGRRVIKKDGFFSALNNKLEFDGCNMPFAVFMAVLFGAVLLCRYAAARDKDERREILTRDSITVGTLVFARPPLKKAFAKLSQKSTGLALSINPKKFAEFNPLKKLYSYLQPEGGIKVMTSNDIMSKYTVKGYENGFADMLKFVESEGGNSKKMLSKEKELLGLVKKAYESLGAKKFEETNIDEIIKVFGDGHKKQTPELKKLYSVLDGEQNPLIEKAKSVNSKFDFATTFLIVPAMLGIALPKMLEQKMKESRKGNSAKTAQEPEQASVNVQSFMNTMNKSNSQAFKSFTQMVG